MYVCKLYKQSEVQRNMQLVDKYSKYMLTMVPPITGQTYNIMCGYPESERGL